MNSPKYESPVGHPFRVAIVALTGAALGFAIGGTKSPLFAIPCVMVAVFGDMFAGSLVTLARFMGLKRTLLLAVVPLLFLARVFAEHRLGQGDSASKIGVALRHAYESVPGEILTVATMVAGAIVTLVLGRWLSRHSPGYSLRDCAVLIFIVQMWLTLLTGFLCVVYGMLTEPN